MKLAGLVEFAWGGTRHVLCHQQPPSTKVAQTLESCCEVEKPEQKPPHQQNAPNLRELLAPVFCSAPFPKTLSLPLSLSLSLSFFLFLFHLLAAHVTSGGR